MWGDRPRRSLPKGNHGPRPRSAARLAVGAPLTSPGRNADKLARYWERRPRRVGARTRAGSPDRRARPRFSRRAARCGRAPTGSHPRKRGWQFVVEVVSTPPLAAVGGGESSLWVTRASPASARRFAGARSSATSERSTCARKLDPGRPGRRLRRGAHAGRRAISEKEPVRESRRPPWARRARRRRSAEVESFLLTHGHRCRLAARLVRAVRGEDVVAVLTSDPYRLNRDPRHRLQDADRNRALGSAPRIDAAAAPARGLAGYVLQDAEFRRQTPISRLDELLAQNGRAGLLGVADPKPLESGVGGARSAAGGKGRSSRTAAAYRAEIWGDGSRAYAEALGSRALAPKAPPSSRKGAPAGDAAVDEQWKGVVELVRTAAALVADSPVCGAGKDAHASFLAIVELARQRAQSASCSALPRKAARAVMRGD